MLKLKINIPYATSAAALMFAAGLTAWFMAWRQTSNSCITGGTFRWINPALECEDKPTISKAGYIVLKGSIADKISAWKQQGKVEEIGVYFRDLKNGPTFGIDDRENFIPASLLKLPLMFSYFKLAEENPLILEELKTLEEEQHLSEEELDRKFRLLQKFEDLERGVEKEIDSTARKNI